ncbi:MAG: aldo/keto reductase [Oscillospiraceae bacterium]|nr:aldo/keto reductase [Oscillospiraceae bacterium]
MEYRINRRTGDRISVVGLGTSYISEASEHDAIEALTYAYENGINYADLATAGAKTFDYYGKALGSVRKNMHYQVHFGANYETGEYGWTTDLETVKRSVDRQLSALKTDYIDYGFIHCMDEESDFADYQENGVLEYLLDLKKQGVVRGIGLSSHTPGTAQKILDTVHVDMLMFSINPGYDYQHGEYANGSANERMSLYRRCEAEGIGISVMKPFSAGQLLDAKTSPFGEALSMYQCIQYALDKPGVLTVLPGIRNKDDVQRILRFFEIPAEEKDYSVISSYAPKDMNGVCVYCNHCQPCPMGLDIGLINKYYDLALAGDEMAKDHYKNLSVRADACARCGHCESRCPFHVKQESRMEEINKYFK